MMRPLERDLDRVLEELSDDFPLLASLVERRADGQKRLPINGERTDTETEAIAVVTTLAMAEESDHEETGTDQPPAAPPPAEKDAADTEPQAPSIPASASATLPGQGRSRAPMRYGLAIQFEDRPDDSELGRLIESTVWINQAHPAYRRAVASRSVGYHISLAVALALASLAVEPNQEHAFITKFLAHWGQALEQSQARRRRRR